MLQEHTCCFRRYANRALNCSAQTSNQANDTVSPTKKLAIEKEFGIPRLVSYFSDMSCRESKTVTGSNAVRWRANVPFQVLSFLTYTSESPCEIQQNKRSRRVVTDVRSKRAIERIDLLQEFVLP